MRRATLLLSLLALPGCSGSLYTPLVAPATGNADDIFACVAKQLGTMGYQRTQYDVTSRWIVAEKRNTEEAATGPSVRKTVDVLDTRIQADSINANQILVNAHTYDEFANTRGIDRQERKASHRAVNDGTILARACLKPATP